MKPVLVLQHQLPENIAYLGTWLKKHNIEFVIFNAEVDKEFPSSIEPYSALAVLGGAMSANDPLLSNKQAEILILQAMYRDIPVIGHCLGGQLMAKALGAKISQSPKPEIGWQKIKYVEDPLVAEWFGTNPSDIVIQWHYETFDIPRGAKLLAGNESCPNQAFSIGKHLAMQFHIEIDKKKLDFWVSDKDPKWETARQHYSSIQTRDEMLNGADLFLEKHQTTADSIYKHWLQSIMIL